MEFDLILKDVYVRNHGDRVPKVITYFLRDDHPVNLTILSNRLSYPSHVSSNLADRTIWTARSLQFEYEESSRIIDSQDINRADLGWKLDTIAARRVNIQPQFPSAQVDAVDVLSNEIPQLELQPESRIRRV